jgi:hypothetical protein
VIRANRREIVALLAAHMFDNLANTSGTEPSPLVLWSICRLSG